MKFRLVLLHSPLVGPLSWRRVAGELRELGHPVVVPSLEGGFDHGPPYRRKLTDLVVEQIAEAPHDGPVALVGHSGAGPLIPQIAEALAGSATTAVFVDATLPHPGRSWFASANSAVRDRLLAMSVDGSLPPWNQWFPPEALDEMIPEEDLRQRFIADLPRLPLSYFNEAAPVCPHWTAVRCGYVQLSAGYRSQADTAQEEGWPTRRLEADHLALLTRPSEVATLIDRIIDGFAVHSPSGESPATGDI